MPPEYSATPSDFTYKNFQYYNVAPVNQIYNFSIGDRLTKDKKLGAIVAASYQDLYRATNTTFFKPDNQPQAPNNLPVFDDILVRQYSTHQKRLGTHLKADYRFNDRNHVKLYGMFVELEDVQHRHTIDTILGIGGRVGFGAPRCTLTDIPLGLLSIGAIDFGIIVDGAVIVAENIARRLGEETHRKSKPDVFNVVLAAAKEMERPVFFSVLMVGVAYLPLLSLTSIEGLLFRPMALTMVVYALAGSLLFAALRYSWC